MKLEMTQKDKNLLIMLSIFVIVVCIGYWGIYPVVKGIVNTNKEITTQKETKEENELKLTQVPMMEADNERFSNEIQGVRESFFPMMESAEIDKYFTELVLGYNLSAYDLAIQMPKEETALNPYVYSKRAAQEETETTEVPQGAKAERAEIEAAEESGGMSTDNMSDLIPMPDEKVTTGIYNATITLRLGGKESDLLRLIEDLSNSDKKIRVCNYSWSEERSITNLTEEGEYDLKTERVLTLTLEVYMYEEVPDDGNAQ